jgi:hypothetical protein
MAGRDLTIRINPPNVQPDFRNTLRFLRAAFQEMLRELTGHLPAGDMVRLTLRHPSLDNEIWLPFMKVAELTVDRIMDEVSKILQSHEEFTLDHNIVIHFIHVHNPHGSGWSLRPIMNFKKLLDFLGCVIQVKNKNDNMCFARALITAKANVDGTPDTDPRHWENIRKGSGDQTLGAQYLHRLAGVPEGAVSAEHWPLFQRALPDYQLVIVSKEHFYAIIYKGPDANKRINLLLHNNHYDIITKMSTFVNRSWYCTDCEKGYSNKVTHSCVKVCPSCFREGCDFEKWVACKRCNRNFPSQNCFDFHKTPTAESEIVKDGKKMKVGGVSPCDRIHKCKCGKVVPRVNLDNPHRCGERYCKMCELMVLPDDHKCYMQRANGAGLSEVQELIVLLESTIQQGKADEDTYIQLDELYNSLEEKENNKNKKDKKDEKPHQFIIFDYECMLSETGKHVPNLIVAHSVCAKCFNKASFCESRKSCKEKVFHGEDCNVKFCEWLLNKSGVAICHNFKGYDSYFIMDFLHDAGYTPTVITTGMKFMTLQINDMKIIDSINFLQMALRKLPDAFGTSESKKGYFPHLFNTPENQDYVGPYPDAKFYDPDGMQPKDRNALLSWYNEHKDGLFNLKVELLAYCKSDVDVLRRSCGKFRDLFLKVTSKTGDPKYGIDPFKSSLTLASACNLVYRSNFLQEQTIALIPPQGYTPEHKCSIKAMKWLKWISHSRDIPIQHAKNGGEKNIGLYRVDGFHNNTIYEFHGCLFHGCERCFRIRDMKSPYSDLTMHELYMRTHDREAYLKSKGYHLEVMWECEYERCLKVNPEMKDFTQTLPTVEPLNPRDAFYGGRTNAARLYHEAQPEETIKYVDVCSLYPWVNKYCKYPVGHPVIITERLSTDIKKYEGLIKCRILPPYNLFHPVLPYRSGGKLMFPLCRTCADNLLQLPCQHSDHQRAITGSWVSVELMSAIEAGYKILNVYEVWHFEKTSCELFTGYIDAFLKLKQQASGWPTGCNSPEEKQAYIDEYKEHEGITLDPQNIAYNPGLRSLSKACLNGFWGKMAQRPNLMQSLYTCDPAKMFELLEDPGTIVSDIYFINDEVVRIQYSKADDFVEGYKNTNIVIGCYTTAHARLKLLSILQPLGDRVLYYDTDSCIYIHREGAQNPVCGRFLGDLTDELDGDTIETFVSGGPKNYAFKTKLGQVSCKVKGFTLDHRTGEKINFKTMAEMVKNKSSERVAVTYPNKIVRGKDTTIRSVEQTKNYGLVYNKRIIIDNFKTLPYGYH